MADTLVGSVSLSASGFHDFGTELTYTYGIAIITSMGNARVMDPDNSPRVFGIGWFALGDLGPSAVDGWPDVILSHPVFIEFERQYFPPFDTNTFLVEYFVQIVRYVLQPGAGVDLTFWHV